MMSRRGLLAGGAAVAIAAFLAGPTTGAFAAANGTAFLQDLGDKAIAMLADPALPKAEREENFRVLMRDGFDLPSVARFILGRYWKQASEAQRADFIDVFQRVMAARFAPYFSGTSEDTFEIVGPVSGSKPSEPVVRSKIKLSGGQLAQVDWRLVEEGDSFRIIDVTTEGVSMGLTLRSEYGSVISRNSGNIDPLIELLRKKVGA